MKKTRKGFLENYSNRKLALGVFNQLGLPFEEILERCNEYRDASAGVPGFIYHTETHAFALKMRNSIIEQLKERAEDIGEEIVSMVSRFGVFRKNAMDDEEKMDLYKFIGKGKVEQGTITNLMAWYALEEVINRLIDYKEE